jgi:hypothetical protein
MNIIKPHWLLVMYSNYRCSCVEKDLQDAGPCCSKGCVIHVLFHLLHFINYNFLIEFLVPILWLYTRHERCLPITSGGTFVKHMLCISNSMRTSSKIHTNGANLPSTNLAGYIFFWKPIPRVARVRILETFFGMTEKQHSCERRGARSAPFEC